MSTYVFLNIPARGHINPTLQIVRELSARGANVIYFLPEPFRELVEAVGGKFQALQDQTRPASTGSGSATPLGDDQIKDKERLFTPQKAGWQQ
jgi:UDP:flavonoid glycosyltransferase YjiC (YdhE family)